MNITDENLKDFLETEADAEDEFAEFCDENSPEALEHRLRAINFRRALDKLFPVVQ